MTEFREELKARTAQVEKIITAYLPREEGQQKTVLEAMNYSFLAGGKRLRPLLISETFRMFGGTSMIAEPFMAAIEMIHTYSLIHDDLPAMDNDDYRRGKLTNHKVYGEAMAILAGDALLNDAYETAVSALFLEPDNQETVRRVSEALRILSRDAGICGMVGGQSVDVENDGKPLTEDRLEFIYALKTGALIEAAMQIGAVLAGASEREQEIIRRAAEKIGFAFQIQDDILGAVGDEKKLGKTVGLDEKNGKTTYVTLHGLDRSRAEVASLTDEALGLLGSLPAENEFLTQLLLSLVEREK